MIRKKYSITNLNLYKKTPFQIELHASNVSRQPKQKNDVRNHRNYSKITPFRWRILGIHLWAVITALKSRLYNRFSSSGRRAVLLRSFLFYPWMPFSRFWSFRAVELGPLNCKEPLLNQKREYFISTFIKRSLESELRVDD